MGCFNYHSDNDEFIRVGRVALPGTTIITRHNGHLVQERVHRPQIHLYPGYELETRSPQRRRRVSMQSGWIRPAPSLSPGRRSVVVDASGFVHQAWSGGSRKSGLEQLWKDSTLREVLRYSAPEPEIEYCARYQEPGLSSMRPYTRGGIYEAKGMSGQYDSGYLAGSRHPLVESRRSVGGAFYYGQVDIENRRPKFE